MQGFRFRFILIVFCFFIIDAVQAETARYRCTWRGNPATSMVIGWDQISGSSPVLYFDRVDHGRKVSAYPNYKKPTHTVEDKNMHNHFVRLSGLKPNTTYYFVIKDSEGVSQRMSFKTAPADDSERLSIIAGGDSRNNRGARLDANKLVSKLRPHFVMFSGDMTDNDTPQEWIEWFNDWQKTFGSDGRIFPIVVTRGNHEASNQSLVNLFDVKSPDLYYALNFGGNLLRIYTLNTLIPSGGAQKSWLQSDLASSSDKTWKFAQYHQAMRPHTESKPEKNELILNWATLFHKYKVNVAVESDAHVVKWTYPIRPSRESGSQDGFIRDDDNGTVYIGEGCWGAPLRSSNDKKSWTRDSDSFNQFKWIFVDKYKIEIRTIKTDGATRVAEVNHQNIFEPPYGLVMWTPRNGGVVKIRNKKYQEEEPEPDFADEPIVSNETDGLMQIVNFSVLRKSGGVAISWDTQKEPPAIKYEIQRSTDGGNLYRTIAQVRSKGTGSNNYQCQDDNLSPNIPYRQISYRLKYQQPSGRLFFYNPPPESMREERITDAKPPIKKPRPGGPPPKPNGGGNKDWAKFPKLLPDPSTGRVKVKYSLLGRANVVISLIDKGFKSLARLNYDGQAPGPYNKSLDVNKVPPGEYLILIKANGKIVGRYRLLK